MAITRAVTAEEQRELSGPDILKELVTKHMMVLLPTDLYQQILSEAQKRGVAPDEFLRFAVRSVIEK